MMNRAPILNRRISRASFSYKKNYSFIQDLKIPPFNSIDFDYEKNESGYYEGKLVSRNRHSTGHMHYQDGVFFSFPILSENGLTIITKKNVKNCRRSNEKAIYLNQKQQICSFFQNVIYSVQFDEISKKQCLIKRIIM